MARGGDGSGRLESGESVKDSDYFYSDESYNIAKLPTVAISQRPAVLCLLCGIDIFYDSVLLCPLFLENNNIDWKFIYDGVM